MEEWQVQVSYFVHGAAIPKNKIYRALNVALLEVMPPCIVA